MTGFTSGGTEMQWDPQVLSIHPDLTLSELVYNVTLP